MRPDTPVFNNCRAGFSMVELTVAVLVLVVGVLGLASVMGPIVARQTFGAAVSEMTTVAESKLEELRAKSLLRSSDTTEVTMGGSLTSSVTGHFDQQVGPLGRNYLRRWLVEAGPSDAREVTLRVTLADAAPFTPSPIDFNTMVLVVR